MPKYLKRKKVVTATFFRFKYFRIQRLFFSHVINNAVVIVSEQERACRKFHNIAGTTENRSVLQKSGDEIL